MARLYINSTLEKSIRSYCEFNGIKDINAFANRCAMQGFNIVKFGVSPKDNINRENNGVKDIKKNTSNAKKKEPPRKNEVGQKEQEAVGIEEFKEEIQPTEEKKENVTVRKIRIIKKQ